MDQVFARSSFCRVSKHMSHRCKANKNTCNVNVHEQRLKEIIIWFFCAEAKSLLLRRSIYVVGGRILGSPNQSARFEVSITSKSIGSSLHHHRQVAKVSMTNAHIRTRDNSRWRLSCLSCGELVEKTYGISVVQIDRNVIWHCIVGKYLAPFLQLSFC